MPDMVGQMLCAKGYTISCAESCTGGLLTSTLTDVPGSSAYVMGSVVSYSNDVKSRILHVAEETLAAHGAVSPETARAMAEGVRDLMQTDVGVASRGSPVPAAVLPKSRSDWSTLLYLLWEKLRWKKMYFLAYAPRLSVPPSIKLLPWCRR